MEENLPFQVVLGDEDKIFLFDPKEWELVGRKSTGLQFDPFEYWNPIRTQQEDCYRAKTSATYLVLEYECHSECGQTSETIAKYLSRAQAVEWFIDADREPPAELAAELNRYKLPATPPLASENCGAREGNRDKPIVFFNEHYPNDAEVEFKGRVYPLDRIQGEIIERVVKEGPIGLTKAFGPHPKRMIEKLPTALQKHLKATPKGYVWEHCPAEDE